MGDNPVDDVQGGTAAGLQVALLDREDGPPVPGVRRLRSLGELLELL